MVNQKLAKRYAQALLDLAIEKNLLEEVNKDMKFLSQSISSIRDLEMLFDSPVVKVSQKLDLFSKIFKSQINDLSFSFVSLLVAKRRESQVLSIAKEFGALYDDYKNITQIILTTANKVDDKLREEIKKLVQKNTNSEIELIEKIDKGLIGGFVLKIGDTLYDSSVSTRIRKVKRELVESKI
jgi:F-type H+-transporting ATPase subunit delta